ncbi:glycosyltransferase family 4 protein [Bacteroides eggerthii]|uniref:Glycosyltransferase family 4 protein n=1 Tax=Bacteroides eggerthii TaxID=28111 RepID=A0ABT7U5L1_9BACE|nr:glycosyltransferase family 4 protein [Bacteroides eggerthii]
MKIFVIGTRGIPNIMGGIETHCEELFPRIAEKGYDITIIRRKGYAKDDLTQYKGVQLIDIDAPSKKSFEAIIHTFKAILKAKSQKADLIHIHAIGPALLTPLARLLGMKVIFTHHGPDYDRDKWGKVAKAILKCGECMGTIFANEVIVISNVIQELLKKKYNKTDCHLIYNGIPTPVFCNDPEYFQELGIESENYILSMCRFVPEKRLHILIEAYSKITNNGCKLVLAGDTDFEDKYSKKIKSEAEKHNIILTGFIKGKQLKSLLSHAKCFVLPSAHEGLPIALLEAMSYNLPVIVSDIPANKEVSLDKDSYFSVDNIDELSSKLQKCVNEKTFRRKYPLEKYNWDKIAEETSKIYNKYN